MIRNAEQKEQAFTPMVKLKSKKAKGDRKRLHRAARQRKRIW